MSAHMHVVDMSLIIKLKLPATAQILHTMLSQEKSYKGLPEKAAPWIYIHYVIYIIDTLQIVTIH